MYDCMYIHVVYIYIRNKCAEYIGHGCNYLNIYPTKWKKFNILMSSLQTVLFEGYYIRHDYEIKHLLYLPNDLPAPLSPSLGTPIVYTHFFFFSKSLKNNLKGSE